MIQQVDMDFSSRHFLYSVMIPYLHSLQLMHQKQLKYSWYLLHNKAFLRRCGIILLLYKHYCLICSSIQRHVAMSTTRRLQVTLSIPTRFFVHNVLAHTTVNIASDIVWITVHLLSLVGHIITPWMKCTVKTLYPISMTTKLCQFPIPNIHMLQSEVGMMTRRVILFIVSNPLRTTRNLQYSSSRIWMHTHGSLMVYY